MSKLVQWVKLTERFKSNTWTFWSNVESALVPTPLNVDVITTFCQGDLDAERLTLHVTFYDNLKQKTCEHVNSFGYIVNKLQDDTTTRCLLTELTKAVGLILTVPVMACTAEWSFPSLRHLKMSL